MKILFVDDSKVTRAVMGRALAFQSHETHTASSAAEARELLGGGGFDLLITDLNMPGEGGLELTRWIRAHPEFVRMPVLLLTADFNPETISKAREAGVDLFIEKTFSPDQLAEAIGKAVKRIESEKGGKKE